jgi:hypothetical protein
MATDTLEGPKKVVKNYSIQGLFITLKTSEGSVDYWLEPKQSIKVPENQISQQIKNLQRRRIVSITN